MSTALATRLDFENPRLATKQDLDHRIAMLDLKIDSLHREFSHAAATQRECVLALLGAVVVFSFCVMLAFMTV